MSQIIEALVYWLIIPVIYIIIVAFDILLVIKARSLTQRWRGIAASIAGILIGIVFILLDPLLGISASRATERIDSSAAVVPVILATVAGFTLLILIDFLLKRGVVPFVILFTVSGMIISGYYLLSNVPDSARLAIAIAVIGFLIGAIMYFIMFPMRLVNHFRTADE